MLSDDTKCQVAGQLKTNGYGSRVRLGKVCWLHDRREDNQVKLQTHAASVMDTKPVVAGSKGCHRRSVEVDQAGGDGVGLSP